jgi:hypothetical protein
MCCSLKKVVILLGDILLVRSLSDLSKQQRHVFLVGFDTFNHTPIPSNLTKPIVTMLVGGLEHEFYDFPYLGNNDPT